MPLRLVTLPSVVGALLSVTAGVYGVHGRDGACKAVVVTLLAAVEAFVCLFVLATLHDMLSKYLYDDDGSGMAGGT